MKFALKQKHLTNKPWTRKWDYLYERDCEVGIVKLSRSYLEEEGKKRKEKERWLSRLRKF